MLVGTIVALGLWVVWLGMSVRGRFAQPRAGLVETRGEPWESGEAVVLTAADGFEVRLGVVRDPGHDRPRPVVIVGASGDESLPREQVERRHVVAGEPRELIWVPGRHVNPRRTETVQPILELVRSRP